MNISLREGNLYAPQGEDSQARLRRLVESWNIVPTLRLRLSDLNWNLAAQNFLRYEMTRLAGVDVIFATATEDGVAAGLSPHSLWLSLWSEVPQSSVTDFANDFVKLGDSLGKRNLSMGGEEFHFVPGIPLLAGQSMPLVKALESVGFAGSEVVDFIGDCRSSTIESLLSDAELFLRESGASFRALTPAEYPSFEKFMQNEFPGRWTREFQFWRSRQDTSAVTWFALFSQDQKILGFARLGLRSRGAKDGWYPGALRLPLVGQANETDSCIGPIGMAALQRGKGGGRALLGLAFESLRQLGAQKTCIDWTDAIRYYSPLRFHETRRYWTGRRKQDVS